MAVDLKYGHVALERGTVADDEPVVVFRAQDAVLPELLHEYRNRCEAAGSPAHHLAAVEASRSTVLAWQATHPPRVPRSDYFAPEGDLTEPSLEAARAALVTALETGTSSLGLVDLEALVPLMRLLGVPTGRLEGPPVVPGDRSAP